MATRLATQSCRPNSSVRSSHQSSVAQKPLSTTSSGASSHAGRLETARWYAARKSPSLLVKSRKTVPLATPTSVAMSSTRAPAVAVLGEVPHRDLDDPLATGFGVGGTLDAGPHGAGQ